jgi:putative ABC transport system permease protein
MPVVVSRRLADRLWPSQDPLGKVVTLGTAADFNPPMTIVGVARDIRHQQLHSTDMDAYRPYPQYWAGGSWYVLRTTGVNARSLTQAATSVIGQVDPNQSFFDVRPMDERIRSGIWQQQAASTLFGLFAALALALASIGIYGVLMHAVSQRTREIGIRLALGAGRSEVIAMVVRQAAVLALLGLALGLGLAVLASKSLRTVLFGIQPTDAGTYAAVAAGLFAIALIASYLPARRASRIDPVTALRYE